MSEVVNVVVAFAVIVFLFRWVTSGSQPDRATQTLGFQPRTASDDMVATISNMFPDIPRDNIRYDLLKTGSVEATTNKVLEKGFLEAPPAAYFTLYPRDNGSNSTSSQAQASSSGLKQQKSKQNLISRFHLENRLEESIDTADQSIGGRADWEDTAAKREASLRERKAKMILAARQRMLAKQQDTAVAGPST